jgi:hypothetical protein
MFLLSVFGRTFAMDLDAVSSSDFTRDVFFLGGDRAIVHGW